MQQQQPRKHAQQRAKPTSRKVPVQGATKTLALPKQTKGPLVDFLSFLGEHAGGILKGKGIDAETQFVKQIANHVTDFLVPDPWARDRNRLGNRSDQPKLTLVHPKEQPKGRGTPKPAITKPIPPPTVPNVRPATTNVTEALKTFPKDLAAPPSRAAQILGAEIGPMHAVPLGVSSSFEYTGPRWHERMVNTPSGKQHLVEVDITSFVAGWAIDSTIPDQFQMFETTMNPMNPDLFPSFIQNLASNYSYWKLMRSEFLINPVLAPNDRGQLMYGFQPDPTSPAPTGIRDLLNIQGSDSITAWTNVQSFRPKGIEQIEWRSIGRGFPMDLNDQAKLGEDQSALGPLDPRFSDQGRVFFASTGLSSGVPSTIATMRFRYHLLLAGLRMTDIQPAAIISVESPFTLSNEAAIPALTQPNAFWAAEPGNLAIHLVNSNDYAPTPGSTVTANRSCLVFSRIGTYLVTFEVTSPGGLGAAATNTIHLEGTAPTSPGQQAIFISHTNRTPFFNNASANKLRTSLYVKVTNTDHAFAFGLQIASTQPVLSLRVEAVATSVVSVTGDGPNYPAMEPIWSAAPCVYVGLGA